MWKRKLLNHLLKCRYQCKQLKIMGSQVNMAPQKKTNEISIIHLACINYMKSEGNLWGIYILSNELTDNWSVFINLFLGAYLDLRIMFNVHMVMQYKSFHFSVSPSVSPKKSYFHLLFLMAILFSYRKEYEPAKENSLPNTWNLKQNILDGWGRYSLA